MYKVYAAEPHLIIYIIINMVSLALLWGAKIVQTKCKRASNLPFFFTVSVLRLAEPPFFEPCMAIASFPWLSFFKR